MSNIFKKQYHGIGKRVPTPWTRLINAHPHRDTEHGMPQVAWVRRELASLHASSPTHL
jgi:hypothetical protein